MGRKRDSMCKGPAAGMCEEATVAAGERRRERMGEDGRGWADR